MNKITVMCHKDHDKGYEDYVGRCLLCEVERLQKPQQKPLTDEQIEDIWADCPADWDDKINVLTLARAIETAHGIKEKNT